MELLSEIKKYAIEKEVPIMQDEASDIIIKNIKENGLINILELGTAIAYTTIKLASINENIKITSIERDDERYNVAKKNVEKSNLTNINLIHDDIYNTSFEEMFDLIIIDAAKAQNKNFFEKFKNNLSDKGLIIIDNLSFHGLVGKSSEIKSKNLKALVRKIENFITFLKENKEFNIEFIEVGDGIAICQKKK
ncbi:MAG: methyltransferase domain-containing protein [Bacilli bacterium]|nr:methyltransferase domain-containing protein [Bacilli bacterium]